MNSIKIIMRTSAMIFAEEQAPGSSKAVRRHFLEAILTTTDNKPLTVEELLSRLQDDYDLTLLEQDISPLLADNRYFVEVLGKTVEKNTYYKKERALYVHLIDNSNSTFGGPNTIKAIDAINPIREIAEVNLLLVIMGKVRNWLQNVMSVLSKEAHESRIRSERQFEDQFEQMLKQCSDSSLPNEHKIQMTEMLTSFRDKMMDIIKR